MADISIRWDTANSRGDWAFEPFAVTQSQVAVANPVAFGYGDGFTTQFALTPISGVISGNLSAQIYRQDWQGNQLLYATPRTNILFPSTLSTSIANTWTANNSPSLTPNAVLGADGTRLMPQVTSVGANSGYYNYMSAVGGSLYTDFYDVKAVSSGACSVTVGCDANGATVTFDALAGKITNVGSNISASGVAALANGWYRVWITFTAPSNSIPSIVYGPIACSFAVGDMCRVPGSVLGTAIPTTAAPATVTDYALSPSGALSTAIAPVIGSVLYWTGTYVSSVAGGGYLETGNDLQTAVLLSLFTDRVANSDDIIPDGTGDPRGWWGDLDETAPIGSRLWLLDRSKQTQEVLNNARDYINEALQWLVDDGVVASMDVQTEWTRDTMLGAQITLFQPAGPNVALTFEWAWKQLT